MQVVIQSGSLGSSGCSQCPPCLDLLRGDEGGRGVERGGGDGGGRGGGGGGGEEREGGEEEDGRKRVRHRVGMENVRRLGRARGCDGTGSKESDTCFEVWHTLRHMLKWS